MGNRWIPITVSRTINVGDPPISHISKNNILQYKAVKLVAEEILRQSYSILLRILYLKSYRIYTNWKHLTDLVQLYISTNNQHWFLKNFLLYSLN